MRRLLISEATEETYEETAVNWTISLPFRLTVWTELLSQKNPLADPLSADSSSVEIQARADPV